MNIACLPVLQLRQVHLSVLSNLVHPVKRGSSGNIKGITMQNLRHD